MNHADLTPDENLVVELALGRIFLLASRPYQEGDVEQYEAARRAILTTLAPVDSDVTAEPCYPRDRHRGAAGG